MAAVFACDLASGFVNRLKSWPHKGAGFEDTKTHIDDYQALLDEYTGRVDSEQYDFAGFDNFNREACIHDTPPLLHEHLWEEANGLGEDEKQLAFSLRYVATAFSFIAGLGGISPCFNRAFILLNQTIASLVPMYGARALVLLDVAADFPEVIDSIMGRSDHDISTMVAETLQHVLRSHAEFFALRPVTDWNCSMRILHELASRTVESPKRVARMIMMIDISRIASMNAAIDSWPLTRGISPRQSPAPDSTEWLSAEGYTLQIGCTLDSRDRWEQEVLSRWVESEDKELLIQLFMKERGINYRVLAKILQTQNTPWRLGWIRIPNTGSIQVTGTLVCLDLEHNACFEMTASTIDLITAAVSRTDVLCSAAQAYIRSRIAAYEVVTPGTEAYNMDVIGSGVVEKECSKSAMKNLEEEIVCITSEVKRGLETSVPQDSNRCLLDSRRRPRTGWVCRLQYRNPDIPSDLGDLRVGSLSDVVSDKFMDRCTSLAGSSSASLGIYDNQTYAG